MSPEQPTELTYLFIGNFVGPLAFKTGDAPRYPKGFLVTVITAVAAAVCALLYRGVCMWYNKRRDDAGTMESFDHAYEDDITDLKVSRCAFMSKRNQANARIRTPSSGTYCEVQRVCRRQLRTVVSQMTILLICEEQLIELVESCINIGRSMI